MSHTPGPWKISKCGKSVFAGGTVIRQHSGPIAASCHAMRMSDETLHANAHLIASAPDLLEALERIVALRWGYDGDCGAVAIAEAAIAKAKGEQA